MIDDLGPYDYAEDYFAGEVPAPPPMVPNIPGTTTAIRQTIYGMTAVNAAVLIQKRIA